MISDFDKHIWSRTIVGEASGEGIEGMRAVAHAIYNRFKAGKWFSGKTISDTCLFPLQFSCWNDTDKNRRRIAGLADDDRVLVDARRIVDAVLDGDSDPVSGATHYYSVDMVQPPNWAKSGTLTRQIGKHRFYAGVA